MTGDTDLTIEREMGIVVERIWEQQDPRETLVEERQMRLF